MSFCPNCGAERKDGGNFCHKCGYDFKQFDLTRGNANSNFNGVSADNSNFNRDSIDNSNSNSDFAYNPNNDSYSNDYGESPNDPHNLAIVFGYILVFIIPIVGLAIGYYLIKRKNPDVHVHGKIIILLCILVWIFTIWLMLI